MLKTRQLTILHLRVIRINTNSTTLLIRLKIIQPNLKTKVYYLPEDTIALKVAQLCMAILTTRQTESFLITHLISYAKVET